MRAALTSPAPTVPPGPGGGASVVCGCVCGVGVDWKKVEFPEQPARNTPAVASRPATDRRRDGRVADSRTGNSADTAVLLTAASAPPPIGLRQSVILAANG
jgi:hypothetical protein